LNVLFFPLGGLPPPFFRHFGTYSSPRLVTIVTSPFFFFQIWDSILPGLFFSFWCDMPISSCFGLFFFSLSLSVTAFLADGRLSRRATRFLSLFFPAFPLRNSDPFLLCVAPPLYFSLHRYVVAFPLFFLSFCLALQRKNSSVPPPSAILLSVVFGEVRLFFLAARPSLVGQRFFLSWSAPFIQTPMFVLCRSSYSHPLPSFFIFFLIDLPPVALPSWLATSSFCMGPLLSEALFCLVSFNIPPRRSPQKFFLDVSLRPSLFLVRGQLPPRFSQLFQKMGFSETNPPLHCRPV